MTAPKTQSADQRRALSSAEAALSRIQTYAEAAADERITPGEAVEQILDELAARPALGRVRAALSRSFAAVTPALGGRQTVPRDGLGRGRHEEQARAEQ